MLRRLTALIATPALTGVMCISMTTPAAATKSGQAVLSCASNLKCNDFLTEDGEHVMCVKGGGCVLCPADPQGTCIVAIRLHTGKITTNPTDVLEEGAPATSGTGASGSTGSGHHSGVILY